MKVLPPTRFLASRRTGFRPLSTKSLAALRPVSWEYRNAQFKILVDICYNIYYTGLCENIFLARRQQEIMRRERQRNLNLCHQHEHSSALWLTAKLQKPWENFMLEAIYSPYKGCSCLDNIVPFWLHCYYCHWLSIVFDIMNGLLKIKSTSLNLFCVNNINSLHIICLNPQWEGALVKFLVKLIKWTWECYIHISSAG